MHENWRIRSGSVTALPDFAARVMKHVVIVGSGPAGLMAAAKLVEAGFRVTLVDHKPAPGRKLLVAGDGGFNLTHAEPSEQFLARYDSEWIRRCVRSFSADDFRRWLKQIGIETYVGSSGKVFPLPGTKPIQVLNRWLDVLNPEQVSWLLRARMTDFAENGVRVVAEGREYEVPADFVVLALGGASWPKTGSDGSWLKLFRNKGLKTVSFASGNSGLELPYAEWLRRFEGTVLKNIRLSAGEVNVPGDCVITAYGLEGKPAYAVNRPLRDQAFEGLKMNVLPQRTSEDVRRVLSESRNTSAALRKLCVPDAIREFLRMTVSKEVYTDPDQLAKRLLEMPISVTGLRPLEEVISTVGGVDLDAVDENGLLRQMKNVYCCGEMLNWDAPTGGYLIQGCVASGYAVASAIIDRSAEG